MANTPEYINPDDMIINNYYIFSTYSIDNIPTIMFGRFRGIKYDGSYKFNNVIANMDASVARAHRIPMEHPNFNARIVDIYPGNIRRVTPVPSGAALFIYMLTQRVPDVDPESIENIVEHLSYENNLQPDASSYGILPPTTTRNFEGGYVKARRNNRETRKHRSKK